MADWSRVVGVETRRSGQILGCVLKIEPVGVAAELNVHVTKRSIKDDCKHFHLSHQKLGLPFIGESM